MKLYLGEEEITKDFLEKIFVYNNGFLVDKNLELVHEHYSNGYKRVQLNGKPRAVHLIIFLMHHGYLPEMVDHEDNDPTNNLISNLRPSNRSQNCANRKSKMGGHSKYLGVTKNRDKWAAEVRKNKKGYWFGRHSTEEAAALAYNRGAVMHHGEFAKLNIIQPHG